MLSSIQKQHFYARTNWFTFDSVYMLWYNVTILKTLWLIENNIYATDFENIKLTNFKAYLYYIGSKEKIKKTLSDVKDKFKDAYSSLENYEIPTL